MRALAGTATLARFAVRRDRVRMLVWVGGVAALVALAAASVKGLYPTQADLDEAAAVTRGNAAAIAFNGPVQGLDTVGGQVAFQAGAMGLVVVALMSVLTAGRLTRGEEETGRLELVRALPVGARAPAAAALAVTGLMDLAVGTLVAAVLAGDGLPAAGSVDFGLSFVLVGLVFAAIAVVAAQVSENTRVVYGSAGALIGVAFVVRAIGDIGDGTVSWFSPIGWAQKARPFAGERWWPFLVLAAAIAASVLLAAWLSTRRDIGAGLVAPRLGPDRAAASLGTPWGLAVRLQRGSVVGWSAGLAAVGAAYGSIAPTIDDFVGHNQALADVLARAGGASLTDSYLATSFRFLALVGAGFAVQSVLRVRGEETALRAEPVLATPVSRRRWAASHLAVAFGGVAVVLAASGLGLGIAYAIAGGDAGVVPRQLVAAMVYAPAVWLLAGVAMAVVGLLPRAATAAWAVFAGCLVVGVLGELLSLPRWLRDASPFEHVPALPAAHARLAPLVALALLAATLAALGSTALGRRDIG